MVKGRRAVASMRRKGESQSGSPAPSAVEALLDSENSDLYRVEPTLELPPLARRRASHIGRPFEPLLDLAHARPQRARTLVEGIDESALRVGPPRRFGVGRSSLASVTPKASATRTSVRSDGLRVPYSSF